jgi:1-acyl-sn-glycerol-3-phosphate acyltransferase
VRLLNGPTVPLPALAFFVAGLRTFVTFTVVTTYILLVGPPAIVIALVFKWVSPLYWLSYGGITMGLALAGVRTRAEGAGHVRRERATVYCVNHASHLEPPVITKHLAPVFPLLSGLYKKELRKVPVMGKVWELGGFVPVDRRDRAQSDQAIAMAVERLRAGRSFIVFPEGTRSRDGELQPFKKGAFVLAIAAQAPIVPVAIIGTQQSMRRGSRLIWPANVVVRFGEPVLTEGLTYADRDRLLTDVRDRIGAMLSRGGS